MSALARYFKAQGCTVNGYDRTCSELTKELEEEGIVVVYDDDLEIEDWRLKIAEWVDEKTIVVRTPAVPEDLPLCQYIHGKSTRWYKRAEILGQISGVKKKSLCELSEPQSVAEKCFFRPKRAPRRVSRGTRQRKPVEPLPRDISPQICLAAHEGYAARVSR